MPSNYVVKTQVSPSNWVTSTGLIDVDIIINYDSNTASFNSLYLKSDIPTAGGQTNVQIKVQYCARTVSIIGSSTLALTGSTAVDLTTHF